MDNKISISQALESGLAAERRRVISSWRAWIILRRATIEIPRTRRRWTQAPANLADLERILSRLVATGKLRPLKELPGLHQVTSPYAESGPIDQYEILMELHPYAAIAFLSALVFHGLTEEFPNEIHAIIPQNRKGGILPLGTRQEDWDGMQLINGRTADQIQGVPVRWHGLDARKNFLGTEVYRPQGYPICVTNMEMTLLHGLQYPEWSGGFQNVLKSWAAGLDHLNLERTIEYAEQMEVSLLRQRVGFILEELGLRHSKFDVWAASAKRGGSSRLLAAENFAPTFNERWKMSINAPISVLHEAKR